MASVIGDKEVIANLHSLPTVIQRKVLRKVLRRVTKPITKAARANVPRRTGQLAKSLGVVIRTYRKTSLLAVVGPRSGFRIEVDGEPVDPVYYAHLVEHGHRIVVPRTAFKPKSGESQKPSREGEMVPGAPFLKPAYDANESTAKSVAIAEIAKEIEKEAEKKAKVVK